MLIEGLPLWRAFVLLCMPSSPYIFNFYNQTLLLLPEKAIFWEQEKALIIADVHLGKVGHFRKAGIAIPKGLEQDDLAVISDLADQYKPKSIIFLGDLFHSEMNNDWDWLVMWRSLHKDLRIILVRGNHDILNLKAYADLNFELHDVLSCGPFLFSHEPLSSAALTSTESYVISGHIHPGITLKGSGRQFLTLPCFQFGVKSALLPAFGKFTGKISVKHTKSDQIFAVAENKVIAF